MSILRKGKKLLGCLHVDLLSLLKNNTEKSIQESFRLGDYCVSLGYYYSNMVAEWEIDDVKQSH